MSRSTKELALGSIMAALAVVLLCLGGMLSFLVYVCVVLASLVLLPVREECSATVAWCCFASAAVLGLLLCPDKECALLYCFLGYYPLLKPAVDKLRSGLLRLAAKLSLFTAATVLMYAILLFVIGIPEVREEFAAATAGIAAATFLLGLLTFAIYDFLLARFTELYHARRRKKNRPSQNI